MDHDIAACIPVAGGGMGFVPLIRIGNSHGQMMAASRVEAVKVIKSFGRLAVAFELLVTNRLIAKADLVGLQNRVPRNNCSCRCAL